MFPERDGYDITFRRVEHLSWQQLANMISQCVSCWTVLNCSFFPADQIGSIEKTNVKMLSPLSWAQFYIFHQLSPASIVLEHNSQIQFEPLRFREPPRPCDFTSFVINGNQLCFCRNSRAHLLIGWTTGVNSHSWSCSKHCVQVPIKILTVIGA